MLYISSAHTTAHSRSCGDSTALPIHVGLPTFTINITDELVLGYNSIVEDIKQYDNSIGGKANPIQVVIDLARVSLKLKSKSIRSYILKFYKNWIQLIFFLNKKI